MSWRPLALILLASLAAAPAAAQQRAQDLGELRTARDDAQQEWSRAKARVDRLGGSVERLRREHAQLAERVRALQDEDPGLLPFLHRRRLEQERQTLRLKSDELVASQRELAQAQAREQIQRLELIDRCRPYLDRLNTLGDRARLTGRDPQAEDYFREALEELAFVADLEETPLGPLPGAVLPQLEQELRLPQAEQERRVEEYERLSEEAQAQARELAPREEKLRKDLAHLQDLATAGYALPTLPDLIQRTQVRLERIAALRDGLTSAARDYARRVAALRQALERRRSAAPPPPPPPERG